MLSSVLAICFLASFIYLLVRRHLRHRTVHHIRGPISPSWLFGYEYAFTQQDEVGAWEFRWMRDYGPTWRVSGFLGTDILMTADPKALQHIFHKSGYRYVKAESETRLLRMFAGPNIANSSAKDHRRHRKIMNPAFSASSMRAFLPLFQGMVERLTEKWKNELTSATEIEVMVNKWLSVVTLDIIGKAAFDYDYGAFDGGLTSPIYKVYDNFFTKIEFKPTKPSVFFRLTWDYIPARLLDGLRYIPAPPFNRIREIHDVYREYGNEIIQEKKSQPDAESGKTGKDVMSLLIKANASEDAKTRLCDDELMAELVVLTTAGHETTASTLTFLLYELARCPEYQTRMRDEVKAARRQVLARGGSHFETDDLDSMVVVTNAIKETLRVHPIVPRLIRIATTDDVLPLSHPIVSCAGETISEIPIKAGQVVMCSLAGYNRIPGVWGDDADLWNPDRFARSNIAKGVNVGMYANLMTFSAGVRGCIGWRFSIIEMQALLVELVNTFEFALPRDDIEIIRSPASLVMAPIIKGKEELGIAMPLRVSLAH